MLKYCLDILVTAITDIINISMDTRTFPKKIKEAHVRPLLKKTYLPKLTEILQACILLEFIFQNLRKGSSRLAARSYKKNIRLSNPLQSAYRKHHSTESALLKEQNDIIISMDKGEVTALTLISTPLIMLHHLHMGRVKFGVFLTCKIGTKP